MEKIEILNNISEDFEQCEENSIGNMSECDSDNDEGFDCRFCGNGPYATPFQLANHVYRHHRKTMPRPFACKYEGCNQCFGTLQSRSTHYRTHTSKKYKCGLEGCGEGFSNPQKLRLHDVHVHKSQAYFHCPFCTRIYLASGGWEKHMTINHQDLYDSNDRSLQKTWDLYGKAKHGNKGEATPQ
jgi:hypothetical protein